MPVFPKSLLVLGASFLTTRTARRLRRARNAVPAQHRALRTLLQGFARTEQGRNFGLEPSLTYEAFRSRVPLRTYEQFAPAIERMKRGEANVLWPGQCALYAVTPGTTGPAKLLPLTEPMLAHFRDAGLASLLFYTARAGHCGAIRGRHLVLGAPSTLSVLPGTKPFEAFAGEVSGIATLNLPAWALRHLYEPGVALAQAADGPEKLHAIAQRARRADITLVAGMPGWLLGLAEAVLREASGGSPPAADLQAIWPNLECIVHGGVPVGPYQDQLRAAFGRTVGFHEVYPASEGFIAAQDRDAAAGLRLLAESGLFFEFLPLSDYTEPMSNLAGTRAVPLEHVRVGENYVLVLTTPAGLCRYVLGDVVRFTSVEPPRLVYMGRTQLQLNAFGEQVMERQLTDSLVAVCERHGWSIVNFHVAPVVASSLTGQKRGRHEWWIELRPGTIATPTGPILGGELDRELSARHPEYAAKRRGGAMETPLVRLVMPGFFEHWVKHHGKVGAQQKLPRCRSDRAIANDLAALACFTD